ncbi:MAG TPA: hypothetical protein VFK57_10345 [Vicinamibacterales bacterium]|nr:hypothetical protein [Vicinamibacterales bacterium]
MRGIEFDIRCPFEAHDADAIRAILDRGFDARAAIKGQPAVNRLRAIRPVAAGRPRPPLDNVPNRCLAS